MSSVSPHPQPLSQERGEQKETGNAGIVPTGELQDADVYAEMRMRYGRHWWVTPDVIEQVDSFTALEPLYLLEDLFIVPFPKYGLWWFLEYRQGVFVHTHGPYKDEETARVAGMYLVE